MRWLWVLLIVSGCAAGGAAGTRRWPEHRKQGDARLADLEKRAAQLEAEVAVLTKELADTRAQLGTLSAPAAPATPAAPVAP